MLILTVKHILAEAIINHLIIPQKKNLQIMFITVADSILLNVMKKHKTL